MCLNTNLFPFIAGPLDVKEVTPIVIGKKFNAEVKMNGVLPDDLSAYRIEVYKYEGGRDVLTDFSCADQTGDYALPNVLECTPPVGPPDAVRPNEGGSILVWNDVCVIADDLQKEATAGDEYAVCFREKTTSESGTKSSSLTFVLAWKLTGGLCENRGLLDECCFPDL